MFQWVRDVLPTLPVEQRPIEFIQESGDIVILPSWWGHGTVSVGDTMGFFKVITNKLPNQAKNPAGKFKSCVLFVLRWLLCGWLCRVSWLYLPLVVVVVVVVVVGTRGCVRRLVGCSGGRLQGAKYVHACCAFSAPP